MLMEIKESPSVVWVVNEAAKIFHFGIMVRVNFFVHVEVRVASL